MGIRCGSRSQVRVARRADAAQHRHHRLTLGTRPLFARQRGRGGREQIALTGTVGTEQPDRLRVGQSILVRTISLLGLRDPHRHVAAGTMRLPPSMPDVCLEHMTIAANKANRHSTVPPGVLGPDGQSIEQELGRWLSVSKLNPRRDSKFHPTVEKSRDASNYGRVSPRKKCQRRSQIVRQQNGSFKCAIIARSTAATYGRR